MDHRTNKKILSYSITIEFVSVSVCDNMIYILLHNCKFKWSHWPKTEYSIIRNKYAKQFRL